MSKPGQKTAMISSTSIDLPKHRREVIEACLREGVFPIGMEHLPARDADAVRVSLDMVDKADIYVGIFAWRYGYKPEGRDISITEIEFNRAVERKTPILVFLIHKDHPLTIEMVETDKDAQKKLAELKERASKGRGCREFKSPEDLRAEIIHALSDLKQREHPPNIIPPADGFWPFIRVDETFPLFRVPGSSIPFPSHQEYLDGDVPTLVADAELEKRLQTHGWASCIDVASVGKTTLALRAATTTEQRTHPVFYLDLKIEIPNGCDMSPTAAAHRLAAPATLLILDNIHHQPELARQIWQLWNAKPSECRGRLLLVGTQIEEITLSSPEQDLTFFKKHPVNPAIVLKSSPEDLSRLAKHLYRRIGGSKCPSMPEPPAEALAEWHRVYGAQLNAFAFAVMSSLAEFQKGKWQLPPSRASAWVREHWLNKLSPAEVENVICLAVYGAQVLEILVQDEALPHPGKMDKLFKLGLVSQTQRGQLKQYRQFELREPGWGHLILAALENPVDEEQVLFAAASRHLQTAIVLSARLQRDKTANRLKRLWGYLAYRVNQLDRQVPDISLSGFVNLTRFAETGAQPELVERFWKQLENSIDRLVAVAWETPLQQLAAFLETARLRPIITKAIWEALENEPEKLATRIRDTQLNWVAVFLDKARAHPIATKTIWDALENEPQKLAARVLETQLHLIAHFLETAQLHPAVIKTIWEALEKDPQKLATLTWETPLSWISVFLGKARAHPIIMKTVLEALESEPQKLAAFIWGTPLNWVSIFMESMNDYPVITKMIWEELENQPQKIAALVWVTELADIATFLEKVQAHPVITNTVRQTLENEPQKLATLALGTQLHLIGSFLGRMQGHPVIAKIIWEALEKEPQKTAALVWATELSDVATFLEKAEKHPVVTKIIWEAMENQPENLAVLTWRAPLGQLSAFVRTAAEHPLVVKTILDELKGQPERLKRRGMEATLSDLVCFAHYAPLELLEIVLRGIRPGHWNAAPTDKGTVGATWLIWHLKKINRIDLAEELATLVLRRANWRDFPPQSGGFSQACWLLANVPSSAASLLEPFLKAICTKTWLNIAYSATSCGQLASGLRQLALHQTVERCRRFHVQQLAWRLKTELERFETVAPSDQSPIIQFFGCAGLCGRDISQRNLDNITPNSVSQLPQITLPHRPKATKVEDHQMQLWLGLRTFVSITRKKLPLPHETIEKTLKLWRANLGETALTPATAAHRVNQSMIAWLETCCRANPPALVPSTEPLWVLAGFPLRLNSPKPNWL